MVEQEISALRSFPLELGEPIQVCCQGSSRALFALRLVLVIAIFAGLTHLGAMLLNDVSSPLPAVVLFGLAIFVTFMGFSKIRSYIDQWGDTAAVAADGVAYRHRGA